MSLARTYPATSSGGKAMIFAFFGAILLAAFFHAAVLLFGGAIKFLFVKPSEAAKEEVAEVEIVAETDKKEEPKEVKKVESVPEPEKDQMPDTTVLEAMEQTTQPAALAAVSLADLESALGGGGGGAGGPGTNFDSGGMVGGKGAPGSGGDVNSIIGGGAGGVAKPRVISSPSPDFPPAVQRKGGSITLMIFVGEDGAVRKVVVESSTEPSLEKPAIDAIRRWKFEPATFQGRKVPAKTRQVIRLGPGKP